MSVVHEIDKARSVLYILTKFKLYKVKESKKKSMCASRVRSPGSPSFCTTPEYEDIYQAFELDCAETPKCQSSTQHP
jgi:hypothetical protein